MALNSRSPIPLYRQLADRIRTDIDAGLYAVAARIPSENAFAERYAIGRPTVRQATDLLVRQGRLERRRGSGTYVLPPAQTIDLFSLAGTSAALQKSEFDTRLDIVKGPVREQVRAVADAEQADTANVIDHKVAEPVECLRIERKATVDGVPVLYETLWFNAELFPGLEKQKLANLSLSVLVRDVYFLEPTSANQTFFVITAADSFAKRLDVAVDTPLLRVYRELHFGEHTGALHAEIVCRTDRFEFSQTLFPARAGQNS